MDKNKKRYLKRLLQKQRETLQGTQHRMDEHGMGDADMEAGSEVSLYGNHPADLGTQLFQQGMDKALKTAQQHQITEVDQALQRMDAGAYGKCELCGKEIDSDRLSAKPEARLCAECQNIRDDIDEQMSDRPIEEDVIDAALANMNEVDDSEYEGLDQLNDLMKYGSSSTPQDMGDNKEHKGFYTNKIDKQGEVEEVDGISNEDYKKQLP